jgi:hypothetical protein
MTAFSSLYGARLDRELGNEDRTVLFTTAKRQGAINEAALEFADQTECLIRTSTVTITGGTGEYGLTFDPSTGVGDFLRWAKEGVQFHYTDSALNVTILVGDDLLRRDVPWLDRYEPGWRTSTVSSLVMQLPSMYYERMDGGQRLLGFVPIPSTGSSASAKAVVPYIAMPIPMTSDTQEPFNVYSLPSTSAITGQQRTDLRPYHQALVHYAAGQLEKLRRDYDASDRQMKIFYSYIQRYWQNTRTKGGTALTFGKNYFTRRRG